MSLRLMILIETKNGTDAAPTVDLRGVTRETTAARMASTDPRRT